MKKVLITAGPTWIALDKVRIISNIASGRIGFLLSKEAKKRRFRVTLALGPVADAAAFGGIKIKRFRYFNDLSSLVRKEVSSGKYSVVIHAAAVSDYQPRTQASAKIKSGSKSLSVKFKPTAKIVNQIKKLDPNVYLVMFKLESGVSDNILIKRAREALIKAKADLVVANRQEPGYKAFILDKKNMYARANSKGELAKKLFGVISSGARMGLKAS